jgi:hypothetical protein
MLFHLGMSMTESRDSIRVYWREKQRTHRLKIKESNKKEEEVKT